MPCQPLVHRDDAIAAEDLKAGPHILWMIECPRIDIKVWPALDLSKNMRSTGLQEHDCLTADLPPDCSLLLFGQLSTTEEHNSDIEGPRLAMV